MRSETLAALAAGIAEKAHAGQVDKAGRPYVEHVRRVAAYVDPTDADAIAAALLHDTLEDTETTPADLAAAGIARPVIDAVVLLTRRSDLSTADYYARIHCDRLAREVKLADLADNTDPARLQLLEPAARERLRRKYRHAYQALGSAEADGERRRQRRDCVSG